MKQKILVLTLLSISLSGYSQVGIKTEKPIGVFNIDGQKDNAGSLTPTAAQQLNDVVVLANGNVGLGATSPNVKFTVVTGGTSTSPKPDIKIVDGNQTAGHTMISDANGIGTWKLLNLGVTSTISPIANQSSSTTISSDNSGATFINTGETLHIPEGRWIVNVGMRFNYVASGGTIDYKSSYYLNGYISSNPTAISQTGFTVESITNNPDFSIGGVIVRGSNYISGTTNDNNGSFIQGSSIINVGPGGVDLHILIENIATPTGATGASWQYTPNNAENIFYAVPINPA